MEPSARRPGAFRPGVPRAARHAFGSTMALSCSSWHVGMTTAVRVFSAATGSGDRTDPTLGGRWERVKSTCRREGVE
jgi:hypothetical protein